MVILGDWRNDRERPISLALQAQGRSLDMPRRRRIGIQFENFERLFFGELRIDRKQTGRVHERGFQINTLGLTRQFLRPRLLIYRLLIYNVQSFLL